MKTIRTQGDPVLAQVCAPVSPAEIGAFVALGKTGGSELTGEVEALHAALADFRADRGFGRAIAAPQLGIAKRIVCMHLGARPIVLINPEITWRSDETFDVWDDCLSVPDVIVRVRRHRSISLTAYDGRGRRRRWTELPESLSELLQHEIDHLDGVLMTERAVGDDAVRPISEHAALVPRPQHRLRLDAIERAAETIDPVFRGSPQFVDGALSEALGCTLTVKLETANPIRSFKGRGADFFMAGLLEAGDRPSLVCASAGNFGQALAYAAGKHGLELTVFASTNANPQKVERMRRLGARVELAGDDFDAAKEFARNRAAETGARMVEDGREAAISEGAGSIAVELLADDAVFDDILVPLGNGALLAGVARWFKAASPMTRVFGVCSSVADGMQKSLLSGEIVHSPSVATIADGIGVRIPVPEAVADLRGLVDDVSSVDDAAIVDAMRLLFEMGGLVAEPAAAVGVAALMTDGRFAGRRVATIVCGSHVAPDSLRRWLVDPETAPR
ncbi:MAG: pyridoxal-phosphate dependent enzyme [Acidobacteriota bacterium]